MTMCDRPNGEPSREAAMVVLSRDAAGEPTVWCDPCLAPVVRALNDGGLSTVASCCGHGRVLGSVCLTDGRVLAVWPDLDSFHTSLT